MVEEMRIIRRICGHIRLDRIRNEVIRNKAKVTPIEYKMRETKIKWFDHVKRKSVEAPVEAEDERRKVGIRCIDDLKFLQLTEDMAQDRYLQWSRIKV